MAAGRQAAPGNTDFQPGSEGGEALPILHQAGYIGEKAATVGKLPSGADSGQDCPWGHTHHWGCLRQPGGHCAQPRTVAGGKCGANSDTRRGSQASITVQPASRRSGTQEAKRKFITYALLYTPGMLRPWSGRSHPNGGRGKPCGMRNRLQTPFVRWPTLLDRPGPATRAPIECASRKVVFTYVG